MEILNQEVLLEMLLKFQEDLKNIEFKYILRMETELSWNWGIQIHCGEEYGVANAEHARATKLLPLTLLELKDLDPNNLDC